MLTSRRQALLVAGMIAKKSMKAAALKKSASKRKSRVVLDVCADCGKKIYKAEEGRVCHKCYNGYSPGDLADLED